MWVRVVKGYKVRRYSYGLGHSSSGPEIRSSWGGDGDFWDRGVLMMPVKFRKTAETPRCPIPGCPFAKAMEEALHEAGREEPMGEAPPEAAREKVAAELAYQKLAATR